MFGQCWALALVVRERLTHIFASLLVEPLLVENPCIGVQIGGVVTLQLDGSCRHLQREAQIALLLAQIVGVVVEYRGVVVVQRERLIVGLVAEFCGRLGVHLYGVGQCVGLDFLLLDECVALGYEVVGVAYVAPQLASQRVVVGILHSLLEGLDCTHQIILYIEAIGLANVEHRIVGELLDGHLDISVN